MEWSFFAPASSREAASYECLSKWLRGGKMQEEVDKTYLEDADYYSYILIITYI